MGSIFTSVAVLLLIIASSFSFIGVAGQGHVQAPIIQRSTVSWSPPPFNHSAGIMLSIIYAENVRAYALGVKVSLPTGVYNSSGGSYVIDCIPITTTQGEVSLPINVRLDNPSLGKLTLEVNETWYLDVSNVSETYNASENLSLTYLGDPVVNFSQTGQSITIEDTGTAPLYNLTISSLVLNESVPYLGVGKLYNFSLGSPEVLNVSGYIDIELYLSAVTPYGKTESWTEGVHFYLPREEEITPSVSTNVSLVSSVYYLLPGYNLIRVNLTTNESTNNMTLVLSSYNSLVTPNHIQVRGNSSYLITLLTTSSIAVLQVEVYYHGREIYSDNFSWIVSTPSLIDSPFRAEATYSNGTVKVQVAPSGNLQYNVTLVYGGKVIHQGTPPFHVSFPYNGNRDVYMSYQVEGSEYNITIPVQGAPSFPSFPNLSVISVEKELVSTSEVVLLVAIFNSGNSSAYDVTISSYSPEQGAPSPLETQSQISPNQTVLVPVYVYGNSYYYNITVKIYYSSQGKPQEITRNVVVDVPSKPTPVGEVISVLSVSYDGIPLLFLVPVIILVLLILLPRRNKSNG